MSATGGYGLITPLTTGQKSISPFVENYGGTGAFKAGKAGRGAEIEV